MIAAEDADGNLLPALEAVTPLRGRRILDLGSGTGRLPRLLSPIAGSSAALDLSRAMLRQQARLNGPWPLVQGDLQSLPFPVGWSEVTTAGWAIGHLRAWYAPTWQVVIGRVVDELERVTTPGGVVVILETLGTGSLSPAPPAIHLAEYYAWLENQRGYTRTQVRTDYLFDSVAEAVACTEFFFGPALSDAIRANNWARLPEWTGIWSRVISHQK